MSDRTSRAIAVGALTAALIAFYALTFSFRGITDTDLNSLQTRSFVLHGDVDLSRYPSIPAVRDVQAIARDGDVYSIYGVGISLIGSPFYLVLVHLGADEPLLQGIVAVMFTAGAAVVLLRALLRIAPTGLAAAATVAFAFGTTMWTVAARAYFQQGPLVFFECVGLAGLFSRRTSGPVLAGLGFGAATFIRPTLGFPLVAVAIVYLFESRRDVFRYAAGATLPVIGLLVQNRWIWGTWLTGGYAEHPIGFHGDMPSGVFGLLLGWWRGILVYSPVLVLGFVGLVLAGRRPGSFVERRVLFLGFSSVVTILFYARWDDWGGGAHQFGYRLLLEIVPLLVVFGTYAVARVEWLRIPAFALGIMSVLTMTWGAARRRDAFDSTFLASDLKETSLWRSWAAWLDRPFPGLLRLAGVIVMAMVILAIAKRLAPSEERLLERDVAAV